MASLLTLGDLNKHFDEVRDRLGAERASLTGVAPLPTDFSRDAYGFSYLRAERIGLAVITETLKEIAWLPIKLDPAPEILMDDRGALKHWLAAGQPDARAAGQPDATLFGNDFIHALTRTALQSGWTSPEFRLTIHRLGALFHDLSCLIGLVYYGVWLAENGIDGVPVTDPHDLERTAGEIARLTRSPEVARLLQRRKQLENERRARLAGQMAAPRQRAKPALRLVEPSIPHDAPPPDSR